MIVQVWKCNTKKVFPNKIGAYFIRKFQGTDYTHYALKRLDNGTFYDASLMRGVSDRSESDFRKTYDLTSRPWIINVLPAEFDEALKPYMGKSYGLRQAIGIGLKWCFKWAKNPFKNGVDQVICNELVLRFVSHFKKIDLPYIDNVTLSETEEILDKYLTR